MTLFWPIFWLGSILTALIAFIVTALRDKSRERAALLAMQPKAMPAMDIEAAPEESMENLDTFPAESFEFDDGTRT